MKHTVILIAVLAVLANAVVLAMADETAAYPIEDFYQDTTTGSLKVWPDQSPENVVTITLTWVESECGEGNIWVTTATNANNEYPGIVEEVHNTIKNGNSSEMLDTAVIVNGETINDFLLRWHDYLETDHPLPSCNTVYLPLVVK